VPELIEVVAALPITDPEATIYVSLPITPQSAAIVCPESEDGSSPAGFEYLLEVSLALQVLDVWSRWRDGRKPTAAEAVQAVIYYALQDAYEPVLPAG
jgi:hypothetical protein